MNNAFERLAHINFCIHTEMIYNHETYQALLKFSKDFYNLTEKKIALCAMTPLCPAVRRALAENNITEETFIANVLKLKEYAEVGYHGHFYREGSGRLIQISRDNYDKELVCGQIRREMKWFGKVGIAPKLYTAGWWFLTEDIVLELETEGVKVDMSVREDGMDSFGSRYLKGIETSECGRPFILPPSKDIVEIRSIFGPIMKSFRMKWHLSKHIKRNKDGDLFFVFPLHDSDITKYYKNIWSNVEKLSRFKNTVAWMDILKMRDIYLKKRERINEFSKR